MAMNSSLSFLFRTQGEASVQRNSNFFSSASPRQVRAHTCSTADLGLVCSFLASLLNYKVVRLVFLLKLAREARSRSTSRVVGALSQRKRLTAFPPLWH